MTVGALYRPRAWAHARPMDGFGDAARAWFEESFEAATPVQQEGFAVVAKGAHALLTAPTGSGKTLAAFLFALDRLGQLPEDAAPGVRVLYVSPLKALVYDVERNLRAPLVASVGHAAAREIMLTGRRYDAGEALSMGLVNRVLADDELEGFVRKLAAELASNAPLSMAASKSIINSVIEPDGDFSAGEALIERCAKSEDHVEGRRAFMEKRKPVFKGR